MSADLRVVKTKENIIYHFLELLKIYPFHKITVSMLITACKINRSTFYRNYEDKYDLLNYILDELMKEFDHAIHPEIIIADFHNINMIKSCLLPMIEFFAQHKTLLILFYGDNTVAVCFKKMDQTMNSKFSKEIRKTFKLDKKQQDIADYYISIVTHNILESMRWWQMEHPELTQTELIDIISRAITKGLFESMNELLKSNS